MRITLGVGVGTGTVGVATSPGRIAASEASGRMSPGGITTGENSDSKRFPAQSTKTTMFGLDDIRVVDADTLKDFIETSEIGLAEVFRGFDGVFDQLLVANVVKRSRNNVSKQLSITIILCVLTKFVGSHSTTAD